MRVGLDLRPVADPDERLARAVEADRLGLWAVLVGDPDGTGAVEAAALATATDHIHLALWLEGKAEHPTTLAEEVAILDHLSRRRALAVVDGPPAVVEAVAHLLAGAIVDGVVLTPPPAQTRATVLPVAEAEPVPLTGDLDRDRATINALRDGGANHCFVTWPGPLTFLARHLATRAADPAFPRIVADLADAIDPPPIG